jgi:hypothetical protein
MNEDLLGIWCYVSYKGRVAGGQRGIVLRIEMGQNVLFLGNDLLLLELDGCEEFREEVELFVMV